MKDSKNSIKIVKCSSRDSLPNTVSYNTTLDRYSVSSYSAYSLVGEIFIHSILALAYLLKSFIDNAILASSLLGKNAESEIYHHCLQST